MTEFSATAQYDKDGKWIGMTLSGDADLSGCSEYLDKGQITVTSNSNISAMTIGGNATLINNGNIGALETTAKSDTTIVNNNIIAELTTGANSTTEIDNNRKINSVTTGANSTTSIDNDKDGTINKVTTGTGSITEIDNSGTINNLKTGANSTTFVDNSKTGTIGAIEFGNNSNNALYNEGKVGKVKLGAGSNTVIKGVDSKKVSGSGGKVFAKSGIDSFSLMNNTGVKKSLKDSLNKALQTITKKGLNEPKATKGTGKPTSSGSGYGSILFNDSDIDLNVDVQQMISYYDDMYLYADVAYDSDIIDRLSYEALKKTLREEVFKLRKANKLDDGNLFDANFAQDVLLTLASFATGPIGLAADILGGTTNVYAATLDKYAMELITKPNNASLILGVIAKNTKYNSKYSVYVLKDVDGNVKYVGRTRQRLDARKKQHWKADSLKNGLDIDFAEFEGKTLKNLSYAEARGFEHLVYDGFGGKNNKNLLNLIRPLDIDNPKIAGKAKGYIDAAWDLIKKLK